MISFKEALNIDIRKELIAKGTTYTLQNDIMLTKWQGIRKRNTPKIKVLVKNRTAYIVNDNDYESEMRTMSSKDFNKLVSNKEVK
jgi:hypothetical protein